MEAKFVGIDVSKARLDVDCLPVSRPRQFRNDAGGIAALVQGLLGSGVQRIVVEATGGYEIAVASALAAAGLPVVVVNPKRVRDFAKAQGVLAKSDRLDARVLALFGERIAPPVRALPAAAQRDLTELLDRRHQLVSMRAQEQARLATVLPVARRDVEQHIAWLDQRIRKHETVLLKRLRANAIWDAKVKLLDSVPGIGPVNVSLRWSAACRSWGPSIASRLPRWSAWPLSMTTAANGVASDTFAAAGPRCAARYTWLP